MQYQEVQKQSKLAFDRWKPLWDENCDKNKTKIITSHKNLLNKYRGKKGVLFAYGPSFKQNIKDLQKMGIHKDSDYVIGCVDKAFKPMVEAGIWPDYCLIADGTVSDKWIENVNPEAIKKSFLISNVYASPKWSDLWIKHSGKSSVFWYLNKDNLNININSVCGTADYFGGKTDYYEVIPAASNVGNSLVVFSRQILGIKEFYLCAYDYCWYSKGNYYGVIDDDKKYLIGHFRTLDINNEMVWSSTNMDFSCRWLETYIMESKVTRGCVYYNSTDAGILKNCDRQKLLDLEIRRIAA